MLPSIDKENLTMADVYFKKPNGEVVRYEAGRMKLSSCESKYIKCDANGKEIKVVKENKKSKK